MHGKVSQGVRIDVTYKGDSDSFEVCYQENGQGEPIVFKVQRGNELYLRAAVLAMCDECSDVDEWHVGISNEYQVDP